MTNTKRTLLVATAAVVVLYLASAAALGTAPKPTDSGAAVMAWVRDHASNIRWSAWLLTLAGVALATYVAIVRSRLPAVWRDVFLIGGLGVIATTIVQSWFLAGMAWHAGQLDAATARTLFDVASYWGPVLTSMTIAMFAPVALLALRGDGGLPRWLGYVTGVFVVEQLVETITVFGTRGFLAPGGPMNLLLGAALFLLSFVATAIALP